MDLGISNALSELEYGFVGRPKHGRRDQTGNVGSGVRTGDLSSDYVEAEMPRNTIVVLDDDPDRRLAMQSCLEARLAQYRHVFFDNAPDMIAWLPEHMVELVTVSLDHDLGPNRQYDGLEFDPGTGRDVADFLAAHDPACPVILATTNSLARPGMELVLQDAGWRTISVLPFSDLSWIDHTWIAAVASAVVKRR